MLLIHCPYCKATRDEAEFSYAGEARERRPENPDDMSDEQWGDYLYFRNNLRGEQHELWCHALACRRYFIVLRDTQTHAVLGSYRMDEQEGNAAPDAGAAPR